MYASCPLPNLDTNLTRLSLGLRAIHNVVLEVCGFSLHAVDQLERALFRRKREPAFDSKFTTFSP